MANISKQNIDQFWLSRVHDDFYVNRFKQVNYCKNVLDQLHHNTYRQLWRPFPLIKPFITKIINYMNNQNFELFWEGRQPMELMWKTIGYLTLGDVDKLILSCTQKRVVKSHSFGSTCINDDVSHKDPLSRYERPASLKRPTLDKNNSVVIKCSEVA